MMQREEHTSTILQHLEIKPDQWNAMPVPIQKIVDAMAGAYRDGDLREGRFFYEIGERHLADESGCPLTEEAIEPVAILRGVQVSCERLFWSARIRADESLN